MKIYKIARIAHEANRALCSSHGEQDQKPWEELSDEEKGCIVNGVSFQIKNPNLGLAQLHDHWRLEKEQLGWIYGKIKDPAVKHHPNLVPFDDLPEDQQIKDKLFKAIVLALDA